MRASAVFLRDLEIMRLRLYLASVFGMASIGAALACINDGSMPPLPVHLPPLPPPQPPPRLAIDPATVIMPVPPPAWLPLAPPPVADTIESRRTLYLKIVAEHSSDPAAHASHADRTHYAVALILLGRTNDAVEVLLAIEKAFPGRYENATNLGTAYELLGNLTEAHRWITEDIRRNPQAHEGTEWLHLAIIEARQGLAANAEWLRAHSVLEKHRERPAAELLRAIVYQLNERLNFVQAPDATVCDLFYEAARLTNDTAARANYAAKSVEFGELRKTELANLKN